MNDIHYSYTLPSGPKTLCGLRVERGVAFTIFRSSVSCEECLMTYQTKRLCPMCDVWIKDVNKHNKTQMHTKNAWAIESARVSGDPGEYEILDIINQALEDAGYASDLYPQVEGKSRPELMMFVNSRRWRIKAMKVER